MGKSNLSLAISLAVLTTSSSEAALFVRGDADASCWVDLSDSIFTLEYRFIPLPPHSTEGAKRGQKAPLSRRRPLELLNPFRSLCEL
jgi:hypothetical protein